MTTEQERLAKAAKPAEDALRLHPLYKGKVQMMPKVPIRSDADFAIWYTPGVAAPRRGRQARHEGAGTRPGHPRHAMAWRPWYGTAPRPPPRVVPP